MCLEPRQIFEYLSEAPNVTKILNVRRLPFAVCWKLKADRTCLVSCFEALNTWHISKAENHSFPAHDLNLCKNYKYLSTCATYNPHPTLLFNELSSDKIRRRCLPLLLHQPKIQRTQTYDPVVGTTLQVTRTTLYELWIPAFNYVQRNPPASFKTAPSIS